MPLEVTRANLRDYVQAILSSAASARSAIRKCAESDAIGMLACMKFEQLGYEPLHPSLRLNLIEQINQTFTCLASFSAAAELFRLHPTLKTLQMNVGTESGTDILGCLDDTGQKVICETFAAVDPRNNKKLAKDISRAAQTDADFKYVFFCAPTHRPGFVKESQDVKVYAVELSGRDLELLLREPDALNLGTER